MAEDCPVCRLAGSRVRRAPHIQTNYVTCPRCGEYQISDDAVGTLALEDQIPFNRFRARLCEWIDNQNLSGITPALRSAKLSELQQLADLEFLERAKRLLFYFSEHTKMLGESVTVDDPKIGAKLQTLDVVEIRFIAQFLAEQKWIEQGNPWRLTGHGAIKADEWKRTASTSMQGFVAMSFDQSLDEAWSNGFEPAIRASGFSPFRSDREHFIGGITDKLIAEIRRSRFVVVDYTGQSNGVYFEAGYALTLGVDVIPTCRADDMQKRHFDIKHLNTLPWQTPEELADRLTDRIRAVVRTGQN
jgi:hypothetical protein